MMLSNQDTNTNKTLFGFVLTEDGEGLKVSGRATRALVKRGLNLSHVMKQVTKSIGNGSVGGGHDIAAGATIPIDKKQKFLELAENMVSEQLRN
jgi:RecJ-like exonuclease